VADSNLVVEEKMSLEELRSTSQNNARTFNLCRQYSTSLFSLHKCAV